MRIRTIKPEFFLHSGIHDAELETGLPLRLAFIGLWCAADREGRFRWEPRRLKIQILPYDTGDFEPIMLALVRAGFIVRYKVNGVDCAHIPSFTAHQCVNLREAQSKLPDPDDCTDFHVQNDDVARARTCTHVQKNESPVHARGEGKGREGKGKEIYTGDSKLPPRGGRIEFPLSDGVAVALRALYRRKEATPWQAKEITAAKQLCETPDPQILAEIEQFTKARDAGWQFYRRDVLTLLNNWRGEVDRCEDFLKPQNQNNAHNSRTHRATPIVTRNSIPIAPDADDLNATAAQ